MARMIRKPGNGFGDDGPRRPFRDATIATGGRHSRPRRPAPPRVIIGQLCLAIVFAIDLYRLMRMLAGPADQFSWPVFVAGLATMLGIPAALILIIATRPRGRALRIYVAVSLVIGLAGFMYGTVLQLSG